MNAKNFDADSPDDDFEYELEDASPSMLCVHCGSRLVQGKCSQCGNLMDTLDSKYANDAKEVRSVFGDERDVELDEYGMPIDAARRREKAGNILEMEELGEGELPASFYAILFVALLLVSIVSVGLDSPMLASLGAGILLCLGGVLGLAVGYAAMKSELGGMGATLMYPVCALVNTFSAGTMSATPNHQGVTVAKWSLLALLGGILCLAASWLLSLVGW